MNTYTYSFYNFTTGSGTKTGTIEADTMRKALNKAKAILGIYHIEKAYDGAWEANSDRFLTIDKAA